MSYLWITVIVVVVLMAAGLGGTWMLTRSAGRLLARLANTGWNEEEDVVRLLRRVTALVFSVVLLISLVPWSLVMSTVGGMTDQFFRNTVNQWMGGPEIFRHLAIDAREYDGLSLHWKQALAELVLRESDDDEEVRQLVSRLSIEDIEILELAAQYALNGNLVLSAAAWNLSDHDLARLEEMGLATNSQLPFFSYRIPSNEAATREGRNVLWLIGHQYGLHLRVPEDVNSVRVSLVKLTDLATKLIRATRRPTNLPYLCELQRYFRSKRVIAEIWSMYRAGTKEDEYRPVSEIVGACDAHNGVEDTQENQQH